MKIPSLILLSIIVPVSLLVSFRLSGILHEPPIISETKTLETISWNLERPSTMITIGDELKNFYSDKEISSQCLVLIDRYDDSWEYGENEAIKMTVNITVAALKGHIETVYITFYEDYEKSKINFFEFHQLPKLENLKVTDYKEWREDSLKAFIELVGIDKPRSASFWMPVHWVLCSPQDQHHQMNITIELVYFNSTVYKKLVYPFRLEVTPDNNDSFQTATEIALNKTYSKLYLGIQDSDDYYKIYVSNNATIVIQVEAASSPKPACYLYLYNPEGELKASSSKWDYSHTIVYTIDLTGYWYIHIQAYKNFGFYNLTVTEENDYK